MPEIRSLSFSFNYKSVVYSLKSEVTVSAVSTSAPVNNMTAIALWDTGATHSVINNRIAETLGLPLIDWGIITGVNSVGPAGITEVNILLPNNILFQNHRVTIADVKNVDMLIGMDIICYGDFLICNSDRRTSFSFVIPPFGDRPDWVQKSNLINSL